MKTLSPLALLVLFASTAPALEVKDIHGNTAEVEILEVRRDDADLIVGGKRVKLNLSDLVPDSRTALTESARAAGKLTMFPPVQNELNVGRRRRPIPGSSYMKTMTMTPSLAMTGKSSMEPVPESTAVMILICMDTRSKYAGRSEVLEVLNRETLTIPAAPNGNRRKFEFESIEEAYDSDRDSTNVGGKVYKYFIFGLKDAATGSWVDFQTTDMKLRSHIEKNPGEKDRFLNMKKGEKYEL